MSEYTRTIEGQLFTLSVDCYNRGEGMEALADLYGGDYDETIGAGTAEGQNGASGVRDLKENIEGTEDGLPVPELNQWLDEVIQKEEALHQKWIDRSLREAGLR